MNECMHATVRELFVSDSVKVYRCANCEETLVAILLVQMGESKLWQQAMPVKQLKMVIEESERQLDAVHQEVRATYDSVVVQAWRAKLAEVETKNARLNASLAGATEILEALAGMHRMYKSTVPDYYKVPDSCYIHDRLTHGHIRQAARLMGEQKR